MFGRLSIGLSGSITVAQLALRLAKSSTSLSPLIQASARLARTGSAPSATWPVVVMTLALGHSTGMRASSLAPAVTEMVTPGSLRSAAVFRRPALSLWISSRLPLE